MQLKLKLENNAKGLTKDKGNAGYDIYTTEQLVVLAPGDVHLFPTGIRSEMPDDYYVEVCERGSTGTKGIARRAGIIDASYRGEWFIAIQNTNADTTIIFKKQDIDTTPIEAALAEKDEGYKIYPLEKAIAQAIVRRVEDVEIIYGDQLSETERGEGKLGSSGK